MPLVLAAAKSEQERADVRALVESKSIVARGKALAVLSQLNQW
jgi:hypothetical protein